MAEAASDSLRISIELPAAVRGGEPVPIVFRIANVSGRPLDLYLRGRTIAFDVVVTRSDGSALWRRLAHEIVPAILRIETLAAGDALVFEHTWNQRSDDGSAAPPGDYLVHAELLTEGDPLASPTQPLRIRSD